MNKKEILSNVMKYYDIIKKDVITYKSSQANLFKKILKEF